MSTEQPKHTPGTMLVDGSTVYILDKDLAGRDVNRIYSHVSGGATLVRPTLAELNEDARRLVACWNALQDLPVEVIEVIAGEKSVPMRLGALSAAAAYIGSDRVEAMGDREFAELEVAAVLGGERLRLAFEAAAQPREHLRDDVAQPHPAASPVPD